jgi:hypothetical protein
MLYCCFTDALLLLYCACPGTNLSPAAAGAASKEECKEVEEL